MLSWVLREIITSLDLLALLLSEEPRMLLALSVARAQLAHIWLLFITSLCSPPAQLLPTVSPQPVLLLPWFSNLQLSLLNFLRFLLAHFSSLPTSLWMAALCFSILTGSPSLMIKPGECTLDLLPQVTDVKQGMSQHRPCAAPLVPGLQVDYDTLITKRVHFNLIPPQNNKSLHHLRKMLFSQQQSHKRLCGLQ